MTSFVLLNQMLWFLEVLFLCEVVVLESITSCVAGKPPDAFLVQRSQAHKVGNNARQNKPVVIVFWKNNCTQPAKVILFNVPNVGYYKVEDCRPFWIVSQKCEASWRQSVHV